MKYTDWFELAKTTRCARECYGASFRDGAERRAAQAAIAAGPVGAVEALAKALESYEIVPSKWDGSIA